MNALGRRLLDGFAAAFGGEPTLVARAPGRVNLIGEHTDYNDGFALPMAIGQETRVAFRPGGNDLVVTALDLDESDSFDQARPPRAPAGDWRNYVRGVVDQLVSAGLPVPAGAMAIAGNVMRGTGLSSSASLEVAVAGALLGAVGQAWDPVRVARLAQRAECDFAGVQCGNLDQIAAAATRRGHALLIDCRSLALRPIPLPADMAVLVVQSGVTRGLVDGEYNLRRQQCEAAARALDVAALRDADEAMLEAARGRMDPLVHARARHVITENRRTLEAAQTLAAGDLAATGRLMRQSHASQAADFAITVAHTDRLAALLDEAIGTEGGARQTGGGFGGAVIGIMPADRVAAVRDAVIAGYRTPDGAQPVIAVETASEGLGVDRL